MFLTRIGFGSTAGRVSTIRCTNSRSKASTAEATAR